MKDQVSGPVMAGIIVVVLLVIGAVGYTMFLKPDSGGGSSPQAEAMQAKAQQMTKDPAFQQKMAAEGAARAHMGHSGGSPGAAAQMEAQQRAMQQYGGGAH